MGGKMSSTILTTDQIKTAIVLTVFIIFSIFISIIYSTADEPGSFYEYSNELPSRSGVLIRSEPFVRDVPSGLMASRILYTTTRHDGSPAIASAIIMSANLGINTKRPTLTWLHGTTGTAPGCAASLQAEPFALIPAFSAIARQGWILVAPDYTGLGTAGGHAYLVGEDASRSALDAIRAAQAMKGFAGDGRVVVWGHSQGGHAALWTGIRAPQYAPDIHLVGVAALAPASDLKNLVSQVQTSTFGKIVSSLLISSYAQVYADVEMDEYVPKDFKWLVRRINSRCVGSWQTIVSVVEALLLPAKALFSGQPISGPLAARLEQNTPSENMRVPLLIAQGGADILVTPSIQRGFVRTRCAAGQPLQYKEYKDQDHISLIVPGSPLAEDIIRWTLDRLEAKQSASNCAEIMSLN